MQAQSRVPQSSLPANVIKSGSHLIVRETTVALMFSCCHVRAVILPDFNALMACDILQSPMGRRR